MITNRLNQLVVRILVLSVCALSGIGFLGLATASANEEPNTPDPKPVSIKASKQEASKSDFKNVETTDPNTSEAKNLNDQDNDIFELKLSSLDTINEAYKNIFSPELISEEGLVKYSTLKRKKLDIINARKELKTLNPAILMTLSRNERIAFWINTYNFCTIELILRNYPIEPKWYMIIYPDNSIMQISGAWTKEFFDIQREEYNLREIEQDFLLKRYKDPRICFTLSNASIGGATLRNEPYRAEQLEEQLDDQVNKYLSTPKGIRWDKDNNMLHLSNLFQIYKQVFLDSEKWASIKKFRKRKDEERIWLNFILPHISEADVRYLETNEFNIKFIEFDWHLNEAS